MDKVGELLPNKVNSLVVPKVLHPRGGVLGPLGGKELVKGVLRLENLDEKPKDLVVLGDGLSVHDQVQRPRGVKGDGEGPCLRFLGLACTCLLAVLLSFNSRSYQVLGELDELLQVVAQLKKLAEKYRG